VVKRDSRKEEAKVKRWQGIAESAAKQSGRGEIPQIHSVMNFAKAIEFVKDFDVKLIPYECEQGSMEHTRELIRKVKPGMKVAIFIGPEGGFEESEVKLSTDNKVCPITLGRRILRTETAGLMILSVLVYELEE